MNGPVSTFTDGHITDHQAFHTYQCQHMGTGVEGGVLQGFQFIAVREFLPHEGNAIAVDGACAGDAQVLDILAMEPHHSFSAIILEGTQPVDALIRIGLQDRARIQMQVDVGFQLDRTCQECLPARQIHLPATLCRTGINSPLDGLGIISRAVTLGTIVHHVKDRGLREKAGRGQQQKG